MCIISVSLKFDPSSPIHFICIYFFSHLRIDISHCKWAVFSLTSLFSVVVAIFIPEKDNIIMLKFTWTMHILLASALFQFVSVYWQVHFLCFCSGILISSSFFSKKLLLKFHTRSSHLDIIWKIIFFLVFCLFVWFVFSAYAILKLKT